MTLLLFILVNAALFIRPAEIAPGLAAVPVYLVLILAALAAALPRVLAQLQPQPLIDRPVTLCVLGVLLAVVLSHAVRLDTWYARHWGTEFGKVVLYYLLLVGVVDTKPRLRLFLLWLAVLIGLLTGLALLHFHKVINIPSLEALERYEIDPETGERIDFLQLRSTGIFNDPNDLGLILVVGLMLALYWLGDRGQGLMRAAWLAPIVLFGYALVLTKSRGGFLALLGALLTLLIARFGWKRSLPLGLVIVPAMLLVFGGRQTEVSTGEGTAQQRIQFWSEGLALFRTAPVFGIGAGNFVEEIYHVAHNSYVQAFVEQGFLGGTLFVGAFYLALLTYRRLDPRRVEIPDPELRRLRPYLMALLVGYAIGLFSLSRNYVNPTYLVLGLSVAYQRMALADPLASVLRLDTRLAQRLVFVGLVALIGLYLFVRVFARYGGG